MGYFYICTEPWKYIAQGCCLQSCMSCKTSRCSCFYFLVSSLGIHFLSTLCMAKCSPSTGCMKPTFIPHPCLMMVRWFYMTKVLILSMISSLRLVESLQESNLLSTDVLLAKLDAMLLLKSYCHFNQNYLMCIHYTNSETDSQQLTLCA